MRCICTHCEADFSERDAILNWNKRSCDRCRERIRLRCPGCRDARRCESFWPLYECPECGAVGTIEGLGESALKIYCGYKLNAEWYPSTQAALNAAQTAWNLLTPEEKMAFAERPNLEYFIVCDSEDYTIRDWGAELRATMNRRGY